ncbi:E3 ubiquitin protein ligase [Phanerochaete sordida]|uniref:E3 ubiquitin protein ligase n=1 Tax=Phanerochaete sordida TaxID=48140 RepID=A0A9P3G872_9APHY|nr:E3 ubiquitin protein ligase [Phanerochaete sordida]
MSTREPLWYCHECHAEMRPLMVPDPHCASCNGTFVEKLENPADDPRAYAPGFGEEEDPFGPEGFLVGLQNLLRASASPPPAQPRSPTLEGNRTTLPTMGNGSGFTIRIDRTSTPSDGPRTRFSAGPARSGDIPLFSDYVSRNGGPRSPGRDTIDGPLMFQYLLAMLHNPTRNGNMAELFEGMPQGPEAGRFGDYVFNQEALDQIITQLMENSQGHPVPATEEVMQKLPREVLTEGSPLLEKDCAVCKEQFQLNTEDPDEQVVVTLPCKHPFHEPCIMPWLKSSGTCPVCRHQLVPQPEHGAPGAGPPGSSGQNNSDNNNNPSNPGGGGSPGTGGTGANNNTSSSPRGQEPSSSAAGLFGSLFNMLHNVASSSGPAGTAPGNSQGANARQSSWHAAGPGSGANSRRGSQDASRGGQRRRGSRDDHELPGSWNDVD